MGNNHVKTVPTVTSEKFDGSIYNVVEINGNFQLYDLDYEKIIRILEEFIHLLSIQEDEENQLS